MRSSKAPQLLSRPRLAGLALFAAALLVTMLLAAAARAEETCPNQSIREQQSASYLPDCRAYELVSPPAKNGEDVESKDVYLEGVPFAAAAEGAGFAYEAAGGLPGSESAGLYTQYLGAPGEASQPWSTLSLNPEQRLFPLEGEGPRAAGEFAYYAPNLTCGVLSTTLPQAKHVGESEAQVPPGESPSEHIRNLYLWQRADNSYTLITPEKPENLVGSENEPNPPERPNNYSVNGASENCQDVIIESRFEFQKAPSEITEEGRRRAGGTLYEWNGQSLEVASKLPDGTDARTLRRAEAGFGASNLNQISRDGSKVFFQAGADEGADNAKQEIFLREAGRTIEVSQPQGGPALEDTGAKFQLASANGQRVFFTANYGLTTNDTKSELPACDQLTGKGCDLYEYDVATKTLTDLSADLTDAHGADIEGVLGASEDGAYIYFSSPGQLVPGMGRTQVENEPATVAEGHANVYVYHEGLHAGSSLSYVSTIGAVEAGAEYVQYENEFDSVAGTHGLQHLVARVSPSGQYLLFATSNPVKEYNGSTYDNEDRAVAGQLDYEQYEFALAGEKVTCVSCNPNRERPLQATSSTPFAALGPFTEVRDGSIPTPLGEQGQVYFNSYSPLLEKATNNTVNAYEWEPEGVGGCGGGNAAGCLSLLDSAASRNPSYVEGASANGESVYITTEAPLVAQDKDELRDAYDVRVGGGTVAPAATKPCEGEECQGSAPSEEPASPQPSETPGVGNPPLTVIRPATASQGVKASRSLRVKGTSARISVVTPGAGRVSASGSGLKTARMAVTKAGVYKLKVALTAKEIKLLKRRHHLKLVVHIVFLPSSGHTSSTTVTVTFT